MTTWFKLFINTTWIQSDLGESESIPASHQENLYCSDNGGWHHIPTIRYSVMPTSVTHWPDNSPIAHAEPTPTPQERTDPMPAPCTSVERNPAAALVNIDIKREDGVLQMMINAKPLHELLDSVGARRSGGTYADAPSCSFSVISVNHNKISPKLFLQREYPVKVALNQHYNQPPTIAQLRALCDSGHEAVRTILAHYQPVDISYTIQKKIA